MLQRIARTVRWFGDKARGARGRAVVAFAAAAIFVGPATQSVVAEVDNELLQTIIREHKLTPQQAAAFTALYQRYLSQWRTSQANARHPVSEAQCAAQVLDRGLLQRRAQDEQICGHPFMVPVTRAGEPATAAKTCIDQFEFPGLPCRFPLTWVTARDATEFCGAMGKRLCDAHEWEGACAGSLEPPDYAFGTARGPAASAHNRLRQIVYAYGTQRRGDICAFGVAKSPDCDKANATGKGVTAACGPNHYPTGYFSQCVTSGGVYDIHGNAAEHMNLPTRPSEMTSAGGTGLTEMKGSWFAFPRTVEPRVHPDDCRWREPGWHNSRVADPRSHANYHLGFRCCASR
jgi:formylglycine-generating enzyme